MSWQKVEKIEERYYLDIFFWRFVEVVFSPVHYS